MNGYIDLYLLPLPKKNLAAYRKVANVFAKVVKDCGVKYYKEWIQDDVNDKMLAAFGKSVKLKPGEVLISSVVEFRNKKHRDQTNKKMMADPRMQAMMKMKPVADMKRMVYGGFTTIVKL